MDLNPNEHSALQQAVQYSKDHPIHPTPMDQPPATPWQIAAMALCIGCLPSLLMALVTWRVTSQIAFDSGVVACYRDAAACKIRYDYLTLTTSSQSLKP
jgi:hypothetical protein